MPRDEDPAEQPSLDAWASDESTDTADKQDQPSTSEQESETIDRPHDAGADRSIEGVADEHDPVSQRIELGVELLANLEHDELSMKATMDRLEKITGDPTVQREIIDTADLRGIIERDGGLIRPKASSYVRFEQDVFTKQGKFECKRCGRSLSTGYFIRFDAGEHGPFGSSCIRKVTGRE